MTARELAALIDKQATLSVTLNADPRSQPCEVEVSILDARTAYGNEQVLVTPRPYPEDVCRHCGEHSEDAAPSCPDNGGPHNYGHGQAWVSADRVKVRGK